MCVSHTEERTLSLLFFFLENEVLKHLRMIHLPSAAFAVAGLRLLLLLVVLGVVVGLVPAPFAWAECTMHTKSSMYENSMKVLCNM